MTTLAQAAANSAQPWVILNENDAALSPAGIFGKKFTTSSGLVFGYYGGVMRVDGVLTSIVDGTVTLTASITNYVEATRAGVVSFNTTGFTAGRIPLYTAFTSTTAILTLTDFRVVLDPDFAGSFLSKAFPSDANYTLVAAEARARIIRMTGAITAQRNVVVPLGGDWVFHNNTTGGFGIQIIGASGTGFVIANAKTARVYSDGTNVLAAYVP